MLRKINKDKERNEDASSSAPAEQAPASANAAAPAEREISVKNPAARLGDILLEERIITKAQLEEALAKQKEEGGFLGQKLIELEYLDQDTLTLILVKQCKIPHLNLLDYNIGDDVLSIMPPELCRKHNVLPVDKMGKILTVAMVNPLDDSALDVIRNAFPDLRIKPILCDFPHFQQVFSRLLKEAPSEPEEASAEEIIPGLPPARPKAAPASQAPAEPETPAADQAPPAAAPGASGPSASPVDVEALRAAIRDGMRETVASLETKLAEASELLRAARDVERSVVSAQTQQDLGAETAAPRTQRLERVTAFAPESGAQALGEANDEGVQADMEAGAVRGVYSFDTFIAGDANRATLEMAKAVAGKPGGEYNPFFVCGEVGLGKTHLINAIGNDVMKGKQGLRVGYTSASRFADHVSAAREEGATELFREAYGHWDALILDDIQFLGGRIEAQEEFFHIFNTLQERGRQIVIAGDRPPEKLGLLEKRLVSRFDSGLVADLKAPEWDTRIGILQHHAKQMKAKVSDDVMAMIAMRYPNDVRRLIGSLRKVVARAKLDGGTVTAALASEILSASGSEAAA